MSRVRERFDARARLAEELPDVTATRISAVLASALVVVACSKSTPTTPTPTNGVNLTAPTATAPNDAAQLATLRPTLSVRNGTSDGTGARTYEFQVSDRSDFTTTSSTGSYPVLARQTAIAEGASGTTTYTPDFDLQPATRLYWRARMVQNGAASDWSATRSFSTAIVGYNRPGELFDPLLNGVSVGTIVGSTTFVDGQGLRLNDKSAYVRYQLAQTLTAGEFSLEIAGLHPGGPGAKLKLFEMSDSTASVYDSPWLFTVQYRGVNGNPDNCISWKMRLADPAFQLEPDGGERGAAIMALDPSHFYFFKGTWDDGFRLIVQNSIGSGTIYNLEHKSTDFFGALMRYQPSPHFAYLGGNDQRQGPEDGTFPGEIVRNVFIGNRPRPASLGSAMDVR